MHVENDDVDSAGLLKKHTADADQQRLAIYFVRQHSANRAVLRFLLSDLLLQRKQNRYVTITDRIMATKY